MDNADDFSPLDLRIELKRFVSRGKPRNLPHMPHKTLPKRLRVMIPHPRPLIAVVAHNLALQLILAVCFYGTEYVSGSVEQACSERQRPAAVPRQQCLTPQHGHDASDGQKRAEGHGVSAPPESQQDQRQPA